jgi:hypothetical protein
MCNTGMKLCEYKRNVACHFTTIEKRNWALMYKATTKVLVSVAFSKLILFRERSLHFDYDYVLHIVNFTIFCIFVYFELKIVLSCGV